jgi:hypothetical protein
MVAVGLHVARPWGKAFFGVQAESVDVDGWFEQMGRDAGGEQGERRLVAVRMFQSRSTINAG